MARWIWIGAALAILAWSLLSWGGYALVASGSDWLAANADLLALDAELQYWLQWSLRSIGGLGAVVVGIVWAAGTAAVLAGAWLVARFTRTLRRA